MVYISFKFDDTKIHISISLDSDVNYISIRRESVGSMFKIRH